MPPSSRKRFSAFDDFNSGAPGRPEEQEPKLPQPGKVINSPAAQVERIERLKPSQMLPDRFQPRRLLPSGLRADFFSGKIDCYQAAREWLTLGRDDPGHQAEIEKLLLMGTSFEEHGQIKPITGSWAPTGNGQFIFLIETGERRFWAACLRTVRDHLSEELLLRVEVVNNPTRQRQVLENRHAEPPSAVEQSCEVAALILAEMEISPDLSLPDEYDYYRQARGQRMPVGLWDRLMPVMQLTRPRMVQLLNILQLPTHLLELADRYRLPERVLREVLALPREEWERMLRLSIQNHLTSEDLAEMKAAPAESTERSSPRPATESTSPGRTALSGLRRFANAVSTLDEFDQAQALDEAADLLVTSGQAEGVLILLGELARLVEMRLSRR